jgi:hypothetical protein
VKKTVYSGGPGNIEEKVVTKQVPIYGYRYLPGKKIRVPSPPRIIPGRYRTRNVKQKINFEAIIGGAENPRFTAPIETDTEFFGKTELGEKTSTVNSSLEEAALSFENQRENLDALSLRVANFLSKHQFVN